MDDGMDDDIKEIDNDAPDTSAEVSDIIEAFGDIKSWLTAHGFEANTMSSTDIARTMLAMASEDHARVLADRINNVASLETALLRSLKNVCKNVEELNADMLKRLYVMEILCEKLPMSNTSKALIDLIDEISGKLKTNVIEYQYTSSL